MYSMFEWNDTSEEQGLIEMCYFEESDGVLIT